MGSRWSEMDQLRKRAKKHGCTVELMGNGHYMVSKDGQRYAISNTPSAGGSLKESERQLRKRGLIP